MVLHANFFIKKRVHACHGRTPSGANPYKGKPAFFSWIGKLSATNIEQLTTFQELFLDIRIFDPDAPIFVLKQHIGAGIALESAHLTNSRL